ncbi:AAA family ATPase [Stackebrandtia soli]|uniref:AAA family ATPase n=1 Tax=Stackebrandtia soli TaxID=1892856 RepID=UPI0039E94B56
MTRVLLTGLSGTGKSTVIAALAKRGYQAVDTDEDGWCGPADGTPPPTPFAEPGWIWRPDRMRDLLSGARESTLFVSGCVENQGDFYEYFDHVVLLSAPESLLRRRLATRTTNGYGKRPEELAEILEQLRTVEPLLRAGASMEVDTSVPLDEVVASLLTLVGDRFERGLSPPYPPTTPGIPPSVCQETWGPTPRAAARFSRMPTNSGTGISARKTSPACSGFLRRCSIRQNCSVIINRSPSRNRWTVALSVVGPQSRTR